MPPWHTVQNTRARHAISVGDDVEIDFRCHFHRTTPRTSAVDSGRASAQSPLMSRLSVLAILVVASLAACDKQPAQKAEASPAATAPGTPESASATPAQPKGQTFGAGVKLTEVTPIDEILADPKKYAGKTVRVEGMITDVCPKRGCWFELAGGKPGQKLRFKVTDGEMVFPMDSKGRKAIAEGVVAVKELTLEQTKERAEYEAKEYGKPFDPASITEPAAIVRIDGTGAIFL